MPCSSPAHVNALRRALSWAWIWDNNDMFGAKSFRSGRWHLYATWIGLLLTTAPWQGWAQIPQFADKYSQQAIEDAKYDRKLIVFDGKSPNSLACDTTLREMPDGSWLLMMLGGGNQEPLPENRVYLSRSLDKGNTWSPMMELELTLPDGRKDRAMDATELMVHDGRATIFVSSHDGAFSQSIG